MPAPFVGAGIPATASGTSNQCKWKVIMEKKNYISIVALLIAFGSVAMAGTRVMTSKSTAEIGDDASEAWGSNYFPNVELTTQDGENVRFFDDLIKDKVVIINFIFTSCPDSYPLETARLAQVARILGDRVGQDVFIYSITIDPDNDTPDVLKSYAQRFDAVPGWTFLTGNEEDITQLRKKLGLYIPEIQSEDSTNHNLSLIIGNQRTGRWMKRSPFENPYILARHVGSWLHNWKAPSKTNNDFANAPKLRRLSDGERLYRTRCAACHTIGGTVIGGSVELNTKTMGPDLAGVSTRRERQWLVNWIREPDKMLKEKDPIAMELFRQFDIAMPNMRLTNPDVIELLAFIQSETKRLQNVTAKAPSKNGLIAKEPWIREAHEGAHINAGYVTLVNTGKTERAIVGAKSPAFNAIELHDQRMQHIDRLVIGSGQRATLKPGAKHMMLIGPKKGLKAGDTVSIDLTFKNAETWRIPFVVRR